VPAPPVHVRV